MTDRSGQKKYHEAERRGKLDPRDPVEIAGDDGKYVDMELAAEARANDRDVKGHGFGSLKKRIGSLKHRQRDE